MEAGKLRHRVWLMKGHERDIADEHGAFNVQWEIWKTARAAIRSASGAEVVTRGHIEATVTHVVTIRFVADVTARMQVWFVDDRKFDIVAVLNEDERSRTQELHCVEVV